MQQHPIPQNITSYQFRLIGDMTIKQFLELLAGGAVAFIFYSTNLPGIIKLPLITLSVFAGIAFAFMPLEERPLDRWILAFIKSIYNPTQYLWRKSPQLPSVFQPAKTAVSPLLPQPPAQPGEGRFTPKSFSGGEPSQVEHFEQSFLNQISQLFTQPLNPTPSQPSSLPPTKPNPQPQITIPVSIAIPPKPKPAPPPPPPAATTPQPTPEGIIKISPPSPGHAAITNPDLPFPSLPTQPNVLVGMILDHQGKIVENAILEVLNENNLPVRATKTNKLGQFFSITPLKRGHYTLIVEKDPLIFDTITLKLEDKIYPPLEIRARGDDSIQPNTTKPPN
ncbi:hypothetical protein A2783_01685 [Microgenomates group bacterium RIFCSPHIGHO2_01_FULL_45_11]|nr:MAG: hypothetical protein A2783_01685 [Microgenomates group bacterium RIFCSPHIGHO2_01_FULL_45_11]